MAIACSRWPGSTAFRCLPRCTPQPRAAAASCWRRSGGRLERLHATGWAHGDLHPGNLLVCASGIVLLDWQRARPRASAAARARDLARLEHALAPFVPRTDRIRLRAAALGCKRPFAVADRAALRAAGRRADHRAEEFARRRTGRLLRPGGEIVRAACGDRHGLRLRTLDPELLAELLAAHEAVLAAPDARVLKDDHRARVTGHALRGHALVVKEAPWRGLGRALADVVRGSAARRAWRAGHGIALRRIGVAVPQAWLERRRAGIPVRSWVVLEDLRPDIPAAFALEHGLTADAVLDALVRLLIDLHRGGIDHGDLQSTHVFLREAAGGLEGRLIDLEAVRFRSPSRKRGGARRWPNSTPPCPTASPTGIAVVPGSATRVSCRGDTTRHARVSR
ncbi:MAG: phosphotransferase [Myxococcota bacterium]|nr:phosphotransferase [Myxococcota bacterium]